MYFSPYYILSLSFLLCSIYKYTSHCLKSGGPAPPAMNCTHVQLYISFHANISIISIILAKPIIDYYLTYITPSYTYMSPKKKLL